MGVACNLTLPLKSLLEQPDRPMQPAGNQFPIRKHWRVKILRDFSEMTRCKIQTPFELEFQHGLNTTTVFNLYWGDFIFCGSY